MLKENYEILERAFLRLGFPTVMVVLLLWLVWGAFDTSITRAEATLNAHVIQSRGALLEARKQTRLLYRMCLVSTEPQKCLEAATLPPEESTHEDPRN